MKNKQTEKVCSKQTRRQTKTFKQSCKARRTSEHCVRTKRSPCQPIDLLPKALVRTYISTCTRLRLSENACIDLAHFCRVNSLIKPDHRASMGPRAFGMLLKKTTGEKKRWNTKRVEKDRCLYVPSVWRDESLWQLCLFGWHYLYISSALCAYNAVDFTTWTDKRSEMLRILSSPRVHPLEFLLEIHRDVRKSRFFFQSYINAKGWSVCMCASASRNVLLVRTLLCVCAWLYPTVFASVDACLCTCVNVYVCCHVRMCSVVMFVTFHVGGSAERQAICSVLKIDML